MRWIGVEGRVPVQVVCSSLPGLEKCVLKILCTFCLYFRGQCPTTVRRKEAKCVPEYDMLWPAVGSKTFAGPAGRKPASKRRKEGEKKKKSSNREKQQNRFLTSQNVEY